MSTASRSVPFSLSRLGIVAGNTFLEAVRQKLFNFLLLLAVTLAPSAADSHAGFHAMLLLLSSCQRGMPTAWTCC